MMPLEFEHPRPPDIQKAVSTGALSEPRLHRVHDVMTGYVERGDVPGLVTLVARHGKAPDDAIDTKAIGQVVRTRWFLLQEERSR